MNKTYLKLIENLLDRKLKPINKKLDNHFKILQDHSNKLNALLSDVIGIQEKVKVLPDLASKLDKIDDHEDRIQALESTSKF